jgi:hypothetical protein
LLSFATTWAVVASILAGSLRYARKPYRPAAPGASERSVWHEKFQSFTGFSDSTTELFGLMCGVRRRVCVRIYFPARRQNDDAAA